MARPPCGVASLKPEARQRQRCQSVTLACAPSLSPREWDELDDRTSSLMMRNHTARASYSGKFHAPRTAVDGRHRLTVYRPRQNRDEVGECGCHHIWDDRLPHILVHGSRP